MLPRCFDRDEQAVGSQLCTLYLAPRTIDQLTTLDSLTVHGYRSQWMSDVINIDVDRKFHLVEGEVLFNCRLAKDMAYENLGFGFDFGLVRNFSFRVTGCILVCRGYGVVQLERILLL